MRKVKLYPCPHCGGVVAYKKAYRHMGVFIQCTKCKEIHYFSSNNKEKKSVAAMYYNRRVGNGT